MYKLVNSCLTELVIEDYDYAKQPKSSINLSRSTSSIEHPTWNGEIRNVMNYDDSSQENVVEQDEELLLTLFPKTNLVDGMSCGGCNALLKVESFSIGLGLFSSNRYCEYTGKWYCNRCHSGKSCVIPARVVNQWDFSSNPVCDSALKTIQRLAAKPIIKIPESPLSSKVLERLARIKVYRSQLEAMQGYIETCRDRDKLLPRIKNKLYLFENNDVYSLHDLVTVNEGNLEIFLLDCINRFRTHIYACTTCQVKGHICEGCRANRNVKPIFPFDVDSVTKCRKCNALYHIRCFSMAASCPRCKRIQDLKAAKARREALNQPAHHSLHLPASSSEAAVYLELAATTKKKVYAEW